MRTLVSELLQYLITIEEELNSLVDQSRMSDVESVTSSEVSQAQESECQSSGGKRVHFAPDLETVNGLLSETSLTESGSTAVEDLRAELDRCLARVRRDVADVLGMSEMTLVGQKPSREVETLKFKLMESERNKEELLAELSGLRERLAVLESKKREVINEGYGDGTEQNPDLEKRLERLSEIQDRGELSYYLVILVSK